MISSLKSSLSPVLPLVLAQELKGALFERISIGCSNATTWRCSFGDRVQFYLKIADKLQDPDPGTSLLQERDRLLWLSDKILTPKMHAFHEDEETEYLVTTALSGTNAAVVNSREEARIVIPALAEGLRALHSLSIDDCPFNQNVQAKLRQAEERVAKGKVDRENFELGNREKTPHEILRTLSSLAPQDERKVITHGDCCLPNIIIDRGRFGGFIDVARCGIADPYQDLAILFRSFTSSRNPCFGAELFSLFLSEYGHQELDQIRARWFIDLDELF